MTSVAPAMPAAFRRRSSSVSGRAPPGRCPTPGRKPGSRDSRRRGAGEGVRDLRSARIARRSRSRPGAREESVPTGAERKPGPGETRAPGGRSRVDEPERRPASCSPDSAPQEPTCFRLRRVGRVEREGEGLGSTVPVSTCREVARALDGDGDVGRRAPPTPTVLCASEGTSALPEDLDPAPLPGVELSTRMEVQ